MVHMHVKVVGEQKERLHKAAKLDKKHKLIMRQTYAYIQRQSTPTDASK